MPYFSNWVPESSICQSPPGGSIRRNAVSKMLFQSLSKKNTSVKEFNGLSLTSVLIWRPVSNWLRSLLELSPWWTRSKNCLVWCLYALFVRCIVPKATDLTLAQKLNDQHLGKHPNFQVLLIQLLPNQDLEASSTKRKTSRGPFCFGALCGNSEVIMAFNLDLYWRLDTTSKDGWKRTRIL